MQRRYLDDDNAVGAAFAVGDRPHCPRRLRYCAHGSLPLVQMLEPVG